MIYIHFSRKLLEFQGFSLMYLASRCHWVYGNYLFMFVIMRGFKVSQVFFGLHNIILKSFQKMKIWKWKQLMETKTLIYFAKELKALMIVYEPERWRKLGCFVYEMLWFCFSFNVFRKNLSVRTQVMIKKSGFSNSQQNVEAKWCEMILEK